MLVGLVLLPLLVVSPRHVIGLPGAVAVVVASGVGLRAGPRAGIAVAGFAGVLLLIVLTARGRGAIGVAPTTALWAVVAGSAGLLADEIRLAHGEMARLALTDALTGAANRRQFDEALAAAQSAALRRGARVALVLIDIDHLKQINDAYGHSIGDAVIIATAEGLRAGVRRHDEIARLGGDEFGIILIDVEPETVPGICDKLRRAVADASLDVDGADVSVSISVGAALLEPGRSLDELKQAADVAMYEAKRVASTHARRPRQP